MASTPNKELHAASYVNANNIENDVGELLRYLKGWEPSYTELKPMTGGFVNIMLLCTNRKKLEDGEVVVRVWVDTIEIYANARLRETQCVKALSDKGCFPKLQGTFENGYCYTFYHGTMLSTMLDSMFKKSTIKAVAKGFALVHSTSVQGLPKVPWMYKQIQTTLKAINDQRWMEFMQKMPGLLMKEDYLKESAHVEKMVEKLGSPMVLCHGDCHIGNILWNSEDDHVKFVDCELTQYNFQAVDIAYHFDSFQYEEMHGRINRPENEDEFRRYWLRKYLQYWYEAIGKDPSAVTDYNVDVLNIQVKKFSLLTSLRLTVLCVQYANTDLSGLDVTGIGMKSYKYYLKYKDEYFNQPLPQRVKT